MEPLPGRVPKDLRRGPTLAGTALALSWLTQACETAAATIPATQTPEVLSPEMLRQMATEAFIPWGEFTIGEATGAGGKMVGDPLLVTNPEDLSGRELLTLSPLLPDNTVNGEVRWGFAKAKLEFTIPSVSPAPIQQEFAFVLLFDSQRNTTGAYLLVPPPEGQATPQVQPNENVSVLFAVQNGKLLRTQFALVGFPSGDKTSFVIRDSAKPGQDIPLALTPKAGEPATPEPTAVPTAWFENVLDLVSGATIVEAAGAPATPAPAESPTNPPTEAPTANPTPDLYAAFPGATPLEGAVSAWVSEDGRLYNQTENRLFVWNETTTQWEVNAFTQKPADFEPVTVSSGKVVDVKADKEVGVTEDILATVLYIYIKGSSQFSEFSKDPAFDPSLLQVGIKSPYEERIKLVHALLNWSGGTLRIREYTFNLNEPGTIVHRFHIVSDPNSTGAPFTPGAIVDLTLAKNIRAVIREEAGKLVVEQVISDRYDASQYGFDIRSSDPLVLAKTFTRFMTTGFESLAEGKNDSPLSRIDLSEETRINWELYWANLPIVYGSGKPLLSYVDAPGGGGGGGNPMNDATPLVFDIK